MKPEKPYLALANDFTEHPKIQLVGERAAWAHLRAMQYCSRYLTDGFIPASVAEEIARTSKVPSLIRKLLDARLWEKAPGGGYAVHDYGKQNRSKAEILALKAQAEALAEAGGRARAASADREQGRFTSKAEHQPQYQPAAGPEHQPAAGPPTSSTSRSTSRNPASHTSTSTESLVTDISLPREEDSLVTEISPIREGDSVRSFSTEIPTVLGEGGCKGGEPGFRAGTPPADPEAKEPVLTRKKPSLSPAAAGSPPRSTEGAAMHSASQPTKANSSTTRPGTAVEGKSHELELIPPSLRGVNLPRIPGPPGEKGKARTKAKANDRLRAETKKEEES